MGFCRNIAVFCGSSVGTKPEYVQAAEQLGALLGDQGRGLVFGGCLDGLMAVVARTALAHGAPIQSEFVRGLYRDSDFLAEARPSFYQNVRERKHGLIAHSDACVMMPGGMGTLDEFSEVCASVQLGETDRPIGILNTAGYYDHFLEFLAVMRTEGFLSPQWDRLFVTADMPEALLKMLDEAV